jgi:sulfite reductase alpha subunit-like flavoprotein
VTIGVVADNFPNKKIYHGVCSHYLFSKIPYISSTTVNVYVEPADDSFTVPEDDSVPLILISAGTGFAPMRSFIHERHARKANGPIYVFFGCRNEEQDILYDEELCAFEEQGLISALVGLLFQDLSSTLLNMFKEKLFNKKD